MALPRKSFLATFAITIVGLAILPGCHPKAKLKPVTVRIFRDLRSPYANELDRRFLEFQASNPRVGDGAPIVLETLQLAQYNSTLQDHVGRDLTTEMVILDSPQDAASNPVVQAELANSVNICAAVKACPAVVPAFVPASLTGAPAEAGRQLLAFLQKQPA